MFNAMYHNRLDVKGPETELAAYINKYYAGECENLEDDSGLVGLNDHSNSVRWGVGVNTPDRWRLCYWGCPYIHENFGAIEWGLANNIFLFSSSDRPMITFLKMLAPKWPQLEFTLSFVNSNGSDSGQLRIQGTTVLDDRYTTVYNIINRGWDFDEDISRFSTLNTDLANLPVRNLHIHELTTKIGVDGPAFLHNSHDTVSETGDYQLAYAYIEHKDTTSDNVWDLLCNAATYTGGGTIIQAAAEATDTEKSGIGRLFETLSVILVPNKELDGGGKEPDEKDAGTLDEAGIFAARKYSALASARGKTSEWLANVQALLPEWHNKQSTDLITAAYLLLGDDDLTQANTSVNQQN